MERECYPDQHRYGWNDASILDLAEETLGAMSDLSEFDHRHPPLLAIQTKTSFQSKTEGAVVSVLASGSGVVS
jgi:hypothetical protein